MDKYPKVTQVRALPGRKLLVQFDNGLTKTYDCTPLLGHEAFQPLRDDAVFRAVLADDHGYGVIWNDAMDLAESELWLNGTVASPDREDRAVDTLAARDRNPDR